MSQAEAKVVVTVGMIWLGLLLALSQPVIKQARDWIQNKVVPHHA